MKKFLLVETIMKDLVSVSAGQLTGISGLGSVISVTSLLGGEGRRERRREVGKEREGEKKGEKERGEREGGGW